MTLKLISEHIEHDCICNSVICNLWQKADAMVGSPMNLGKDGFLQPGIFSMCIFSIAEVVPLNLFGKQ